MIKLAIFKIFLGFITGIALVFGIILPSLGVYGCMMSRTDLNNNVSINSTELSMQLSELLFTKYSPVLSAEMKALLPDNIEMKCMKPGIHVICDMMGEAGAFIFMENCAPKEIVPMTEEEVNLICNGGGRL